MKKINIYKEKGYKNRKEYLLELSDEFGIEYTVVLELANMLGASEDFDGLISSLEDYRNFYIEGAFDYENI